MTALRAGVALRPDPRKTLVEDSVISGIISLGHESDMKRVRQRAVTMPAGLIAESLYFENRNI